jgi:hypothetical protein
MSYTEPDPEPEPSGPSPSETAAVERAAQLERDNVFLRAGVDTSNTDDPKVSMLLDSFAAGLPDVAAVKARAELLGLGDVPLPPSAPTIPGEETQGEERQALGNAGRVEPDPGDVDPRLEAKRLSAEALKSGATMEDALATGFHAIAVAGLTNQDPRALAKNNGPDGF